MESDALRRASRFRIVGTPAVRFSAIEGFEVASHPFRNVLTSEEDLRNLIGPPSEIAFAKRMRLAGRSLSCIHRAFALRAARHQRWRGRCDVSSKGDEAGFVLVVDDRSHLVIPIAQGNKRLDGLRSILVNPHIGCCTWCQGTRKRCESTGRRGSCVTRGLSRGCRGGASGRKSPSASRSRKSSCTAGRLRYGRACGSMSGGRTRRPRLGGVHASRTCAACGMTLEQMERRLEDDKNRLYFGTFDQSAMVRQRFLPRFWARQRFFCAALILARASADIVRFGAAGVLAVLVSAASATGAGAAAVPFLAAQ